MYVHVYVSCIKQHVMNLLSFSSFMTKFAISFIRVSVPVPADFISIALGGPEQNTKAILEFTRGKVLVIDEAYMLGASTGNANSGPTSDPYRAAVVDTIVSEVQSRPGEDPPFCYLATKTRWKKCYGTSIRDSHEDSHSTMRSCLRTMTMMSYVRS